MKTKSDHVREEIAEYLKSRHGEKVRQTDLTEYLMANSTVDITGGIIRGIFNKMDGIGGIYIPIPHIKIFKEDKKVYYYYDPTPDINISGSNVLGEIKNKVIEFEGNLHNNGLLNVGILELTAEERRTYLKFIEQFEQLKSLFNI